MEQVKVGEISRDSVVKIMENIVSQQGSESKILFTHHAQSSKDLVDKIKEELLSEDKK